MNGVIHNCSHGAGTDHNTRMTEEEMMVRIFNYLDHLVQARRAALLVASPRAALAAPRQQRSA